jgi:ribonuclease HII
MLKSRFQEDDTIEIGIDEAGRGSFWGPIMAGAVIIPPEGEWTDEQRKLLVELRDSKKISPKKRDRLFNEIKELIPECAVGIVSAREINENGITWANMEAFRRAIRGIADTDETISCRLIIDGVLPIEGWGGQQELVVEGDGKYLAVAAASILAKVEHDRWIKAYCDEHPACDERYSLYKSKGYGTAAHREAIKLYGGHELHRELYIKNWLPGAPIRSTPRKKSGTKKSEEPCLIKFGAGI